MKLTFRSALLVLITAVIPLTLLAESATARAAASRDAAQTYANLPLHFEPAIEPGHFVARSGGYAVSIGVTDSAIAVTDKAGSARTLRFSFDSANAAANIEALEPLPGVTNYYLGSDQRHWRLGVRNYAKLRTKDIYPGVDVVYYGDNRRLEFDFVVAPMADPRAIALKLSGMDKLYVNADGDLVAELDGRPVHFAKPRAYQKVAGVTKPVSVEYVLADQNKAQLRVGDYDKNLELVIDPLLSYSTYLGGSQGDTANGIAVDTNGNAYITGQTSSIGKDANPVVFPSGTPNTTGTSLLGAYGSCDAYVTKLSADGSTVLFTTFIAGASSNEIGCASGNGIALDSPLNSSPVPNGYPNVYVVGSTNFPDMPLVGLTPAPATCNGCTWNSGDHDAFIMILDSTTGTLIRSTYLGGSGDDQGYAIAVDQQQNVIVGGQTNSINFPAYNGFEPRNEAYLGFVTKLDFGLHIAPPTPGASAMSPRASSLTDTLCGSTCPPTIDPTKVYYFFSALYGGQLEPPPDTWAYASGIPIPYGTITTVTPQCQVTSPPTTYPPLKLFAQNGGTTGGIDWANGNQCETYVVGNTVVDSGGINWLVLGIGPFIPSVYASTEAYGVALDPATGDVFAVGGSSTASLQPSLAGVLNWPPQADIHYAGTGVWIMKLLGKDSSTDAGDAGTPVYVTALGTNPTVDGGNGVSQNVNTARGVTVDSEGRAYVVGTATGGIDAASGSPKGGWDAFILRMSSSGAGIDYSEYLGGSGNDQGLAVAVDAGGWAYIAGSTQSTDLTVINAIAIDANDDLQTQLGGTPPNTQNVYLVKISPDGTDQIMSAYLGGSGVDQANAIALSPTGNGNIYIAGNTTSSNFPMIPAAPATPVIGRNAYAGNGDAFVTEILGASFPAATVSPITLNFGNQAVGFSSSTTQTVTLTSTGPAILHITSVSASGDFSATPCPTQLNPAGSSTNTTCTITVTFTPTAYGTRSGTLTITDDATNSPQTVGLQGNGVLVQESVTPSTIAFGSQTLATTSTVQYVTVKNTDSAQTLIVSSVVAATNGVTSGNGDFAVSSNGCTTLLTPGQSCTIGVTFTPSIPGSRIGTLVVNGNGANFPATVQLTGTGNGAGSVGGTTADITLSGPTASVPITSGTPATFSITVAPVGGFTGNVNLTCTGSGGASCTISPNSVTVSSTTSPTATVTVNYTGKSSVQIGRLMKPGRLLATLLPFGGIGLIFAGRRKRWLLLFGLIVCLALGLAGCSSGGSGGGSSPQVTITATPVGTAGTAHTITVTLSVSSSSS